MILVVASSPEELQGYGKAGPWASQEIVTVVVGVGKVQSALGTMQAIRHYQPTAVIGIGTCGAVRDNLRIGDMLIASSVVQYDIDLRPFKFKRGELPTPKGGVMGTLYTQLTAFSKPGQACRLFTGQTLGTADRFLVAADRQQCTYLTDELHIDATDMESYAMLAAAQAAAVPCGIIRVVSDTTRGTRPQSYGNFLAETSLQIFHLMANFNFPTDCQRSQS
jgi:adenosylhomocysteine nucleosidase